MLIDTHAHLDAPELQTLDSHSSHLPTQRQIARNRGVALCVIPAVKSSNFETVRTLAHINEDAYALGLHPLYIHQAHENDLMQLERLLSLYSKDPRLVAVGEIGLDFFVPHLQEKYLRDKQIFFYRAQLKLAKKYGLPIILHTRHSVDISLKYIREIFDDVLQPNKSFSVKNSSIRNANKIEFNNEKIKDYKDIIKVTESNSKKTSIMGIAHAFNGSLVQAQQFIHYGLKLGFGGAVTFDSARHLRRLARDLPIESIVLETDAPDIVPQWLYVNASDRQKGIAQGINTPGELPRIAKVLADIRQTNIDSIITKTTHNALCALPGLQSLLKNTSK